VDLTVSKHGTGCTHTDYSKHAAYITDNYRPQFTITGTVDWDDKAIQLHSFSSDQLMYFWIM